jgi:hypothetical protein
MRVALICAVVWLSPCHLVTLSPCHGQDGLAPSWQRWYEAVRPAEREQKWKRVPWETDLMKAVKEARAEKRLLFIWVSFDEPLDRC